VGAAAAVADASASLISEEEATVLVLIGTVVVEPVEGAGTAATDKGATLISEGGKATVVVSGGRVVAVEVGATAATCGVALINSEEAAEVAGVLAVIGTVVVELVIMDVATAVDEVVASLISEEDEEDEEEASVLALVGRVVVELPALLVENDESLTSGAFPKEPAASLLAPSMDEDDDDDDDDEEVVLGGTFAFGFFVGAARFGGGFNGTEAPRVMGGGGGVSFMERKTVTLGATAPMVSSSGLDTMFSSSLSGSASSWGENHDAADEVPARTASISPAEVAYLKRGPKTS
jgi:hypothetical protein